MSGFFRFFVILVALGLIFKFLKSGSKKKEQKRTFHRPNFNDLREKQKPSKQEVDGGELVEDPLTKVNVAKKDAVKRKINGEIVYFANEENYIDYLEKLREKE